MGPRERLRRREADWIARRIRNLLDVDKTLVWDKRAKEVREVKPGDIALLFRALSNVEYYEDALQRHGIDYYLVGGHAFYAQQEIYDLLNLLRTLDSPGDEVSLAGALRIPMFSLHDETLFWLCKPAGRDARGLAAALLAADLPGEIEGEQRRRTEFAAATLRGLRALKDRLPVAGLIQAALERTGYDAMLVAEFLGERKLANLHKLVEQARSFDRAGIFTLSDFITQLAEFVARQPDEPLAATCPESADVVRLMTIHQAKGLEFPVVIVPDVGRPRRIMPPPADFTPELGPVLKDPEATTGYDLLTAAENEEELEEIKRLFYVAATRAADYLILSAGVEQPGETTGPWTELLARRFDLLSGAPRPVGGDSRRRFVPADDPVGPSASPDESPTGVASYNVRVTTVPPPVPSPPADLRRRRDLVKIVEKARQMAAAGQGQRPRLLAPVPCDPAARRQYSFSRLTGKLHAQGGGGDVAPSDGDASLEPPLDPRGLGTLVHAVLAEIDFRRPQGVAELVGRLADEHLPQAGRKKGDSPHLCEAPVGRAPTAGWSRQMGTVPFFPPEPLDEPIAMIERFLASPRAAEIATATDAHRELEFLLAWPPGAKPQAADASEQRYLQGFIDCLYRDAAGRWRLVDYKTNRVTAEGLAAAAAQYEMQMLVYALAAETILATPPAELALCFLRPGLEYHVAWGPAARQRAIEMVDAALP